MMHTTSIKPLSSLERRLRFKLSFDEIDERFERNAEELAQEARLPGFRPGKVPRSLIKDRYRETILKKIHSRGVQDAMEYAEHLDDLDVWKITHVDIDKPDDLNQTEYIVDFVVRPNLDLSQIGSLNLCSPKIAVDEDFLKRGGSLYRFERATGSEVDRPVQNGDRVIIEIEDIASTFTGDIRGTYAEWAQDYIGKHQVVVEQWLYDDDQLGSLLHDELLNRSAGDEFVVEQPIPSVPLESAQHETGDVFEEVAADGVTEVEETGADTSTEENEHTRVSIFSWLDSSRLPQRYLHVKVKILTIEEILAEAADEGFFARDDVPYNNLRELNDELKRYVDGTIQQGTRDAKQAQVTAQICALNPIDLPYRILAGEHQTPPTDEKWSELGSTFVPDVAEFKPSILTSAYFRVLEGLFIRQYAEEKSLEPTDDLVAEFTLTEYERLSKLGLDSEKVFDPEYQKLVRNNVLRTRVMTDIFERNEAPDVTVSFFDFYFLSRSGLWTQPPDGGPFSWTSPVSAAEIEQTLEAETRADDSDSEVSREAIESSEELSTGVKPRAARMPQDSDVERSQGNVFTSWFRNKFRRSNRVKANEDN